jgi:hypothetical protein
VAENLTSMMKLSFEGLRTEREERHKLTDRVDVLEEDGRTTRNRLAVLERKKR